MLLGQAVGAILRQGIGLFGLSLQLHRCVLQAGQAGLQVRLLAEHRHFQLGLDASAIGVHAGDKRVAGGLLGKLHQAPQTALLPMQPGKPERNGQQRGRDESHRVIEGSAYQKADLTDEDEWQPFLQYRKPTIAAGHTALARVQSGI